ERTDALAFDALVARTSTAGAERGAEAGCAVVVRVDHAAFRRGHTEAGEVCEVAGVGPIPVSVADRLSDDAILKALIVNGQDVRAVAHLGRTIPARLRTGSTRCSPNAPSRAATSTGIWRSITMFR